MIKRIYLLLMLFGGCLFSMRAAVKEEIYVNHIKMRGVQTEQVSLNNHSENKQQKHPPQNPPIDGPVTAGHTDVL